MMNGGDDRHFVIAPACNIDMRGLSRGGMSSLRRDEQRCGQDCSVLPRYAYLIIIPFDMGGASGDMERERFCFARCRRPGQGQFPIFEPASKRILFPPGRSEERGVGKRVVSK